VTVPHAIAIDLGASHGRIVLGRLHRDVLKLEVPYRFEHAIQSRNGRKCWDWEHIATAVAEGLRVTCDAVGAASVSSVSCSAWALDFGLLDAPEGRLFYPPVSYRDSRTDGLPERFAETVGPLELRGRTGSIGGSPVTPLWQLRAMVEQEPEALRRAGRLLWVADLIHYQLCGKAATDWTLATASQMRNVATGTWDDELLEKLAIPTDILPPIVNEPSVLGTIPEARAPHPKLVGVPVVTGVGHDTSAACTALMPLRRGDLLLSAGTWAIFAACTEAFMASAEMGDASIGALGMSPGMWGLVRGGMGLWLLQECRRMWRQRGEPCPDYDVLEAAAAASEISSVIAVNDPQFFAPDDMPREIARACEASGQAPPETPGDYARVVYHSLAEDFRVSAGRLSEVAGLRFEGLRMFSGGSRSAVLARTIARALGMPVTAGLPEAASVGNLLAQYLAVGELRSEEEGRSVVERSFPLTTYAPEPSA
jgi:sugar (pentulose or hexulose) kinase